jgi:LytS/YehU family sensor histidine kinase
MNFGGYPNEHPPLWDWLKIAMRAFYALLQGCLAVGVKLVLTWYTNEKKLSSMEKSRMASELKMLKDQVNPHFLFNTLNNLYGLVARNTTHAQESILRLSGILHFMLHESNSPTISMQKEIRCIQDYIELEKLRYSGTLSISFNVQESVRELHVVPLTLFPFVENSFKHGASELIRDAWINIDFSVYKNEFVFKIENSKRPLMISPPAGGIGLSNVKRRLELVYEQDHSLQIIDSPETFLVILKITLNRMQNPDQKKYESQMSYRRG